MKRTSSKKWGRFTFFLVIVVTIFGLTAGTSVRLWKSIQLGLDLKGGFDLLYQVENPNGGTVSQAGMNAAVQAIELRVNNLGLSSPQISIEHGNWIRVDVAGAFDQQTAANMIGTTPDLKIYGNATYDAKTKTYTPDKKTLLMSGSDIKSDSAWVQDPNTGQNEVQLNYKNPAKWQAITKEYLSKPVYIFMNGKLLTDPVIQSIMSTGNSVIYGPGLETPQECMNLSKELNAGALPYPLKLISSINVGPSLGMASLKATMWAAMVAILLIFSFMLIMYRMAGLIANIALVAYAYLTLATFAGLHVVLTLSGLAALVLGLGIAVDANIITYERIKDEVRNGKSLQSSVIAGNKRALRTIIDSNATTFIAGAVMYWFGQGDIRGFAIALMTSIIISLLTAVFLGRVMLIMFVKSNLVNKPWWFGSRKGVAKS